jgi:hypothetical protein
MSNWNDFGKTVDSLIDSLQGTTRRFYCQHCIWQTHSVKLTGYIGGLTCDRCGYTHDVVAMVQLTPDLEGKVSPCATPEVTPASHTPMKPRTLKGVTVHLTQNDVVLCNPAMTYGNIVTWPKGHMWVKASDKYASWATCPACLTHD